LIQLIEVVFVLHRLTLVSLLIPFFLYLCGLALRISVDMCVTSHTCTESLLHDFTRDA